MLPLVRVGDRLCAICKPLVPDVCSRHRKLRIIFGRMFIRMGGGLGFVRKVGTGRIAAMIGLRPAWQNVTNSPTHHGN